MSELLIARQPIFNRSLEVVAYELLYRSTGSAGQAQVFDGDLATTQVIVDTFSEIGLESIVGNKIAFINMTRNFLTGKIAIPFSPNQVILEILEDVVIDQALIQGIQKLDVDGYTLALDDVITKLQTVALLNVLTIVKIDLMQIDRQILPDLIQFYRQNHLKLLAEKVETSQDYELCHRLGFDLFQGYFLCRPNTIRSQRLDSSRLVLLQSLAKLQDPEATFESLEAIIEMDVNLGYKLIKLVNSAYYYMPTAITSIRQAIAIIGFEQLRGWISLLLMMAVQNKPHELTAIALLRARMCELIAKTSRQSAPEAYFLVGLLSVLDALMDIPMTEIVEKLPLAPDVVNALLHYRGKAGRTLEAVILYERGELGAIFTTEIQTAAIQKIYMEAIQWVNEILSKIQKA
jgi:EAL and modified HD-GYP domain-containing signal transduction protein